MAAEGAYSVGQVIGERWHMTFWKYICLYIYFGIGATICTYWEIQCQPYARFTLKDSEIQTKFVQLPSSCLCNWLLAVHIREYLTQTYCAVLLSSVVHSLHSSHLSVHPIKARTDVTCRELTSVGLTVHSVQCTLYSVHFAVYSVQCSVQNVNCEVYSV